MCVERYTRQMEIIRKHLVILILDKVEFKAKKILNPTMDPFCDRIPSSSHNYFHALIRGTLLMLHKVAKGTLQMQLYLQTLKRLSRIFWVGSD